MTEEECRDYGQSLVVAAVLVEQIAVCRGAAILAQANPARERTTLTQYGNNYDLGHYQWWCPGSYNGATILWDTTSGGAPVIVVPKQAR